jgi:hypothetical protein
MPAMAQDSLCYRYIDLKAVGSLGNALVIVANFSLLGINNSQVSFLSDGRVIMVAAEEHQPTHAVLMENAACFGQLYDADFAPLADCPGPKLLLEHERDRVSRLNQHLGYFQAKLNERLGTAFSLIGEQEVSEYFRRCRARQMDMQAHPDVLLSIGILAGEVLRKKLGGRWIMAKRYGALAPYLEPSVLADDYTLVLDVCAIVQQQWFNGAENLDFFFKLYGKRDAANNTNKADIEKAIAEGKTWFYLLE